MTIAPVWTRNLPPLGDTDDGVQVRHAIGQKIINVIARSRPDMAEGKPALVIKLDDVAAIERELQDALSVDEYACAARFFTACVKDAIETLGWRVLEPGAEALKAPERAPLTPKSFADLAKVRKFEDLFLANLEKVPKGGLLVMIGEVLVSAIMFGGLIGSRCVGPWLDALLGNGVRAGANGLWIEMKAERFSGRAPNSKRARTGKAAAEDPPPADQGATAPEAEAGTEPRLVLRRWFADPLTEVLILRLLVTLKNSDTIRGENIRPQQCLHAYLQTLQADFERLKIPSPKTVRRLQAWSEIRIRLLIPSFLVEYAACRAPSVSLPATAWARVRLGKAVPVLSPSKKEADPHQLLPAKAPFQGGSHDLHGQLGLLEKIMHVLRPPTLHGRRIGKVTAGRGKAAFEKVLPQEEVLQHVLATEYLALGPTLYYLVSWATDLLSPLKDRRLHRHKRKALSPNSVYRYLGAIAEPLIEKLLAGDICSMDGEDIETVYRDIANAAKSDKEKTDKAAHLAAFHEFLTSAFSAEDVDFSDIYGSSQGAERKVRANLVSIGDFKNVLHVLGGEAAGQGRLREISALITILGYRCGLRRSEALYLRIGDIMWSADPTLIIRTNRYANTKSESSSRLLPLRWLIPTAELERLRSWVKKRIHEDSGRIPKNLLFTLPGEPEIPLPANAVFNPITAALHQVTGDCTLRYHDLRHSFVTFLLIRLLQRNEPNSETPLDGYLPDILTDANLTSSHRAALLGPTTGRRIVYAVSALAGHADPFITLLSYVHLNDLSLALALSTAPAQPTLTVAAIANITGLSHATLYRRAPSGPKSENDFGPIMPWTAAVRRQCLAKLDLRESLDKTAGAPDLTLLPDEEPPFLLWRTVSVILEKLEEGGDPPQIAADYHLKVEHVTEWGAAAERLRAMKTSGRRGRHANDGGRLFSNAALFAADRYLIDRMFDNVSGLMAGSQGMLKWCVEVVLQRYNNASADVRFGKVPEAQNFRNFLRRLGVRTEEIFLLHYPQRGQQENEAEEERRKWAEEVDVPFEQTRSRGLGNDTSGNPRGRIGFKVAAAAVGKVSGAEQIDDAIRRATPGFRYGIYFIAVLSGLIQKKPGGAPLPEILPGPDKQGSGAGERTPS